LNKNRYLFAYDINGVCLFHPAIPELVGWNSLEFKDMNGQPVVRWINGIRHRPKPDASGWLFYLWPGRFIYSLRICSPYPARTF
jgi:signal transduction histidine kinase